MKPRKNRHRIPRKGLGMCFACHAEVGCYARSKNESKLPRKLKQKLYAFLELTFRWQYNMMGAEVSSCDKGRYYREHFSKHIHKMGYFRRHSEAIKFLINANTWEGTGHHEVLLNEDFKLSYYWEGPDSDMGCPSGYMPFEFEQVKDHWAFEELKEFLERMAIGIALIKNEEQLLDVITGMLKRGEITMVKNDREFSRMVEKFEGKTLLEVNQHHI